MEKRCQGSVREWMPPCGGLGPGGLRIVCGVPFRPRGGGGAGEEPNHCAPFWGVWHLLRENPLLCTGMGLLLVLGGRIVKARRAVGADCRVATGCAVAAPIFRVPQETCL